MKIVGIGGLELRHVRSADVVRNVGASQTEGEKLQRSPWSLGLALSNINPHGGDMGGAF